MTAYTRDEALAEARRLDRKGTSHAENYAICIVAGGVSLVFGLFLFPVLAEGARYDNAETFRTWGRWLLIGGGIALAIGLLLRSTTMRHARRIRELSETFGGSSHLRV